MAWTTDSDGLDFQGTSLSPIFRAREVRAPSFDFPRSLLAPWGAQDRTLTNARGATLERPWSNNNCLSSRIQIWASFPFFLGSRFPRRARRNRKKTARWRSRGRTTSWTVRTAASAPALESRGMTRKTVAPALPRLRRSPRKEDSLLRRLFFLSPRSRRLAPAVAYELSRVLDTGLDKETLSILIALCENGVNPEVRIDVSPAATVSLVFADPRPDLDPLSLSLSGPGARCEGAQTRVRGL